MRARHLSKRAAVLLLLILLVPACRGGGEPEPTAPPPPDPSDPDPITLEIEAPELASMDNTEILVGAPAEPDRATAEAAVEATRAALERFLNAQFVDEATRFTEGPARALLAPGVFDTLPPEQRAAMGVQYQPVLGVLPGKATGTATVLFDKGRAYAVSIAYQLQVDLFYEETSPDPEGTEISEDVVDPQPLTHSGTVLFTAPSWTVESFEFRTQGPDIPVPPPSPEPSP